ncbi:ArsR family transcriptional regulator [Granulicella pectinivorans]|jgi:ArsR family transcriptional regulator|uniref:ArsR family transcriptional regulator n=1 Tax=Granulicella pectinivorans TaxID=474950 RepID=A0A1I6MAD4_9BACT|nr:metalloregulator ArsR/SmtB family transcription factor [Granulicella pectinivorans]SFS12675.1 ArsR family transcriptional regulator [Granulicella pectinivorans]
MAKLTDLTDSDVAQIGKALGDPNRLEIYTQIAQCDELWCGDMCAKHTISAPTLSHHLKVLTDLGLIASRKEGLNVYYRVIPEKFAAYLKYLVSIGPKSPR